MALTQSSHHAGPLWDETIVPALRKRLQGESRVLSKRMSNMSISSAEESHQGHSIMTPTASPRPSTQQTSTDGRRPSIDKPRQKPTRSRTYSQPFAYDVAAAAKKTKAEHRPTRIPKAAGSRSPRVTSPAPGPSAASLWAPPAASGHSDSSRHSSIRVPTRQRSNSLINDEQPPFPHGGYESIYIDEPPRPSIESEERPYEHWYRGESSRNGGVGELRVGNRSEMLDIANYGHSVRRKEFERRRKRAESVGAGARGSFYLEDNVLDVGGGMVVDEAPLTDVDMDDEGFDENEDETMKARSITPTASNFQSKPLKAPPSLTRGASEPPTPTPRRTTPSPSLSVTTKRIRTTSPSNTPSTPAQKRMNGSAVSSPSGSTPARQRQRQRALEHEQRRAKEKAEQARRSIVRYPSVSEGDLMHAIPSWTQPVARSGNWDEVVLPAVARKKGLDVDGSYETTDGSPKPNVPQPVEPAPGTFGYDHSKYRPPRNGDVIPLDEFGRDPGQPHSTDIQEDVEEPIEESQPQVPPPNHNSAPLPIRNDNEPSHHPRMMPPASPVPFAHYATEITPQSSRTNTGRYPNLEAQKEQEEEDQKGGCCKCVIM